MAGLHAGHVRPAPHNATMVHATTVTGCSAHGLLARCKDADVHCCTCRLIANRFLRKKNLAQHQVEQHVEW